jgi:hypothetical protein
MPKRTYETCGKAFASRRKAERYARNIATVSGARVPVYETTGYDIARPKLVKATPPAR